MQQNINENNMPEVEHYQEQLGRLHRLIGANEKPLWQLEQFGWDLPVALQEVKKYTAGTVTIAGKEIEWSVLSLKPVAGKSWREYVKEDVANAIIAALEKAGSQVGIGLIEEISFCDEQPINPENQELANGVAPATITIDESNNELVDIPSGSILLFPNALKITPYRDSIPDIPHAAGIATHEWAHQFMSTENTTFFQEWIQSIHGWEQKEDKWVYRGKEPTVTAYATLNPVDDFVESMMFYVLKPEQLQQQHPGRYGFCHKFIEKFR